jgi:arsenical pump membrane protein
VLTAAGATALASNLTNNLPAGLLAGAAVANLHGHDSLRAAVAIGIDLGPNLSVTGSLATVLWLIALRREKIDVTAWTFLRAGALVMPPALILATLSILATNR